MSPAKQPEGYPEGGVRLIVKVLETNPGAAQNDGDADET